MRRILVVVNTFKINPVPRHLIDNLSWWTNQHLGDCVVDLVVSDCKSLKESRDSVFSFLCSNSVENIHTHMLCSDYDYSVYMNFNLAIKLLGDRQYDFFVYNSEDAHFQSSNCLMKMISKFQDPSVALASPVADKDNTSYYPQYGGRRAKKVSSPKIHRIKIGESTNMHMMFFSRYFMEKYSFKYLDVLMAFATESLLTFLTAAIGKIWVHCEDVLLRHYCCTKQKGFVGHLFYPKLQRTFDDVFGGGRSVGLGFECCTNMYPFDSSLYDHWGRCLKPDLLYEYICKNLFLPKEVFDYDEELRKCIQYPDLT